MTGMFFVELVCSDPECDFVVEAAGDPDALALEICECGCLLAIVSVAAVELVEPLTPLERARARRDARLPLAA
jgi:hypothetical protein